MHGGAQDRPVRRPDSGDENDDRTHDTGHCSARVRGVLAAQPAQRIAPNEAPNLAAPAALLASTKQPPADAKIYGLPATPRTADRTVDITPSTRWINVKQDETVVLRSGGQTYAWASATWSIGSFPLGGSRRPSYPFRSMCVSTLRRIRCATAAAERIPR